MSNWIIKFNQTPTGYLPYIHQNIDKATEDDYMEFGAQVNKIYKAANGKLTEMDIPELQRMAESASSMPSETREQRLASAEAWKQMENAAFTICKNIK